MMKNVYLVPNHIGNSIKKRKISAKNGIKFEIIIFLFHLLQKWNTEQIQILHLQMAMPLVK